MKFRLLQHFCISLAGAAMVCGQAAKLPVPAPVKPPAPAAVKPPAPAPVKPSDKPAPTVTKAVVIFQALDLPKPANATVSVYLVRKDGFFAAMKQGVSGAFPADHAVDLEVFGAPLKADLSKIRVSLKPAAAASWRFDCLLILEWSDKSKTPIAFENILLTERNKIAELPLGGL